MRDGQRARMVLILVGECLCLSPGEWAGRVLECTCSVKSYYSDSA